MGGVKILVIIGLWVCLVVGGTGGRRVEIGFISRGLIAFWIIFGLGLVLGVCLRSSSSTSSTISARTPTFSISYYSECSGSDSMMIILMC